MTIEEFRDLLIGKKIEDVKLYGDDGNIALDSITLETGEIIEMMWAASDDMNYIAVFKDGEQIG